MSQEQADQAGMKDCYCYFSATYGKANLFPRSETLDWHHMTSVSLGNGGSRPDDEIGVVTLWRWPNALDGVDLCKVQDLVSSGEWAQSVQSKDWVGYAVATALSLNADNKRDKARIKSLLRTWIANNALKVKQSRDPDKRRDRPVVVVGNRV